MKKVYWIKGTALLLCAGLLVGLCGCGGDGDEPTPTTTTTTTATTTSTATTTTTGEETTTTTAETTTATAAPVTNEVRVGEEIFRLGDQEFRLNDKAAPLLAFLGEPKTKESTESKDAYYGDLFTTYTYEDFLVETVVEQGTTAEMLVRLVIYTGTYSFDGVKVGDTAEEIVRAWGSDYEKRGNLQQTPSGIEFLYAKSAWWKAVFKSQDEDFSLESDTFDMNRTCYAIVLS